MDQLQRDQLKLLPAESTEPWALSVSLPLFHHQLGEMERHCQQQRVKVQEQQIFAGCTYDESVVLSAMAARGNSIYQVLEPERRAQRRNQDFQTEPRYFQKILLKYDDPIPVDGDLVAWFTRFEFWATNHQIPLQARYVKIVSDLLDEERATLLLYLNDGAEEAEQVSNYAALKRWLYTRYDAKRAITRVELALHTWTPIAGRSLSDRYQAFMTLVHRYCHEIRFAKDYGLRLNQLVLVPEGILFASFLNKIESAQERQMVWQLYQDLGGPKRLDILRPICAKVDENLRPGLGVDAFVEDLREPRLCVAMIEKEELTLCEYHGWVRHTTAQCQALRGRVRAMQRRMEGYRRPRPTATQRSGQRGRRRKRRSHYSPKSLY